MLAEIAEGLDWGGHKRFYPIRCEVRAALAHYCAPASTRWKETIKCHRDHRQAPFCLRHIPSFREGRSSSRIGVAAPSRRKHPVLAFDHGLALGADGLELDVHLSRDGVVVVHHDRSLDRTTNLHGPIAGHTAEDLARADAGYRFAPGADFPFRGQGVGVPKLVDALNRYRDVPIIVELKVNTAEMAQAVVAVVRAAGAVDWVCLASFGRTVLREARAQEPSIATSAAREEVRWALYRSWCRWPVAHVAYNGYQDRNGRAVLRWCRHGSSRMPIAPGLASRCGRLIPRQTRGDCWTGALTG